MRTIRFLVPALLSMAGLASAQDFGALSSCAQNCVNNMRTSIGCVPVTDQCLCSNSNFENGIRDCANQACTAEDAAAVVEYAGGFCLKATGTTTTAAVTTPETTNTNPPPPPTTAEPETTTTPTTASEPTSAEPESVISKTETSTASAATTETSTSSAASTTASEASDTASASSASKTTSEPTSGTESSATESASSTTDAAAAAASPSDSGLSVGAKAGIAVGAGAAIVALLALAVAYCRTKRARRPLPRATMQISEPLPGSGRLDYDDGPQFSPRPPKSAGSKFSQMTELDTHARRYEDMLPRVSPRRMV